MSRRAVPHFTARGGGSVVANVDLDTSRLERALADAQTRRYCPRDCGRDCRDCVLAPRHSDAAHRAITAELVACTLGARRRPELVMSTGGRLAHTLRRVGQLLHAGITGHAVRGDGIEPPTSRV